VLKKPWEATLPFTLLLYLHLIHQSLCLLSLEIVKNPVHPCHYYEEIQMLVAKVGLSKILQRMSNWRTI
jgi:hypothetical protein